MTSPNMFKMRTHFLVLNINEEVGPVLAVGMVWNRAEGWMFPTEFQTVLTKEWLGPACQKGLTSHLKKLRRHGGTLLDIILFSCIFDVRSVTSKRFYCISNLHIIVYSLRLHRAESTFWKVKAVDFPCSKN